MPVAKCGQRSHFDQGGVDFPHRCGIFRGVADWSARVTHYANILPKTGRHRLCVQAVHEPTESMVQNVGRNR